ncbi:hypothetical protein CC77DRAFT_483077 [Alternaria alternata]|uniref:Uncharacterized protein n=1 Tax=Alternaria alternata TaxID=5599 RepID=A0A177D648_ALTAL|nr:hypothetical protein CC77DRAFT_483077 [Alternaria alternata]OAG15174.1 hypothetical protein CC77DRAFT_483077 [Alternaria alternata]
MVRSSKPDWRRTGNHKMASRVVEADKQRIQCLTPEAHQALLLPARILLGSRAGRCGCSVSGLASLAGASASLFCPDNRVSRPGGR